MNKWQKAMVVERLAGHELDGWRAGWKAGEECAMNYLTVAGFKVVLGLDSPTFKRLNAIIRSRGETKAEQEVFWLQLVGGNLGEMRRLTAHRDFAPAFVQRVREVWEEVREDVLAEVAACPGREQNDEFGLEETPDRPVRRGPTGRRQSRRGARGRFGRWGS